MMGLTVFTVTLFCLCFGPVLTLKRLYELSDLTSIPFGKKFPHNGLMLLYWFTAHIDFDSDGSLTTKDYDPTKGDYGSKTYINRERLLPRIPRNIEDESYYIIGNLRNGAGDFPKYVNQDYYNAYCSLEGDVWSSKRDDANRNRDRIIFRLKVLSSGHLRILEVYITQTAVSGLRLSPDLTYEVTPQLLKEIKDIMQHKVAILCPSLKYNEEKARNMFEDQNLAWFLTLADYDVSRRELCLSNVHCSDYTFGVGEDCLNHLHCSPGSTENEVCDWTPVSLKVSSTANGKATMSWNIPDTKVEEEGLTVALFKNDDSSSPLAAKVVDELASGSFPTSISLNAGLQVRLLVMGEKQEETLWRGPEMDDANNKRPVKIGSTDASMQLFTRDGLAYLRLYVKKSFTNWKSSFPNDWAGYHQDKAGSYVTWVYLRSLVQTATQKFTGYDVYEHFFNQTITPEASIQLYNAENKVTTTTIPWDE